MDKFDKLAAKIKEKDCNVEIIVKPENIPVHGNVIDSGDRAFDKKVEDEILARLDRGDPWAWAYVRVRVSLPDHPQFFGEDTLGGCSYKSEAQFLRDAYFKDMKRIALDELREKVAEAARSGKIILL
jgi:hypothetical protein